MNLKMLERIDRDACGPIHAHIDWMLYGPGCERIQEFSMWGMSDLDYGWTAGVIEGEGCYTVKHTRGKAPRLDVVVSMTDADVIYGLHRVVGAGRVYGPRRNGGSDFNKPIYTWGVYRTTETLSLACLMYPVMRERRRSRIAECLDEAFPRHLTEDPRLVRKHLSWCPIHEETKRGRWASGGLYCRPCANAKERARGPRNRSKK